jgi:hypothetical protein
MSTSDIRRQRTPEDEGEDPIELEPAVRRRRVDPAERDEYEEWRRERACRGRKRRRSREFEHPRRDLEDF